VHYSDGASEESEAAAWLEPVRTSDDSTQPGTRRKGAYPRCSFCGKKNREVETLIAGRGGYICNECIQVCVEILAEERKQAPDHD
jgi:hypothetical protein